MLRGDSLLILYLLYCSSSLSFTISISASYVKPFCSHMTFPGNTELYPCPTRLAPGASLLSAGQTVLKAPQSFSSELSLQSFCLLHVNVELMQRPETRGNSPKIKLGMTESFFSVLDEKNCSPFSHRKSSPQLLGGNWHCLEG